MIAAKKPITAMSADEAVAHMVSMHAGLLRSFVAEHGRDALRDKFDEILENERPRD